MTTLPHAWREIPDEDLLNNWERADPSGEPVRYWFEPTAGSPFYGGVLWLDVPALAVGGHEDPAFVLPPRMRPSVKERFLSWTTDGAGSYAPAWLEVDPGSGACAIWMVDTEHGGFLGGRFPVRIGGLAEPGSSWGGS